MRIERAQENARATRRGPRTGFVARATVGSSAISVQAQGARGRGGGVVRAGGAKGGAGGERGACRFIALLLYIHEYIYIEWAGAGGTLPKKRTTRSLAASASRTSASVLTSVITGPCSTTPSLSSLPASHSLPLTLSLSPSPSPWLWFCLSLLPTPREQYPRAAGARAVTLCRALTAVERSCPLRAHLRVR